MLPGHTTSLPSYWARQPAGMGKCNRGLATCCRQRWACIAEAAWQLLSWQDRQMRTPRAPCIRNQPHLFSARKVAAPPAGLPRLHASVALHPLNKDQQPRVGLLHHSGDALRRKAPVRGNASAAPRGRAVGLVVEVGGKHVPAGLVPGAWRMGEVAQVCMRKQPLWGCGAGVHVQGGAVGKGFTALHSRMQHMVCM